MKAKHLLICAVALSMVTWYCTFDAISSPGQHATWVLPFMWVLTVLSGIGAAFTAYFEGKEAKEKEENSPEAVASKLQVELIRAKHDLDMARLKQEMPPEPSKSEVRDGAS